MKVIPPLIITDAMLTSSSVAEPYAGETAYNAGTTYALNATVSVIGTNSHHVYESLQSGNVGNTPATSPLWWLDLGPTNRWKMFDLLRNTQTVAASPLSVTLTPGSRVNSLAIFGMVADSITISATNAGVNIYSKSINLSTRNVVGWYTYFFEPFSTEPSLVLFDLPPYTNIVITVTLTSLSGTASCGGIVIGNCEFLGATQYSAVSDTINFSSVTRDAFGNAAMVPRRNIPKTTQTLELDKTLLNRVSAIRDLLNATVAVWSGLDDTNDGYFDALLVLGFYRTFSFNLNSPTLAIVNLDLEEI